MRYFGAHVSTAGGLKNAIIAGEELQVNTIQIHPSAPQRWITKDIPMEQVEAFIKEQKKTGNIKQVFAHAIYLINLAHSDKQKFHLSKMALVSYLNLMKDIGFIAKQYGAEITPGGVVVHPGSGIHYKTEEEALDRVKYAVNWILEQTPQGTLLLEASAGAGQVIGDRLEELAAIREGVEQKDRVQFALDTQHMFVSGYNWPEQLENIVNEIDETLGLGNVKIIHFNDSKTPMGSKKDRHENVGEGLIGAKTMEMILNHPRLRGIPFVLETPCLKEVETAKIDVEKIRSWALD